MAPGASKNLLEALGSLWGASGEPPGGSWSLMEPAAGSGKPLESLWTASWSLLEASGQPPGASSNLLEPLGSLWAASGGAPGATRSHQEPPGVSCSLLEHLGSLWEPSGKPPGASSSLLEPAGDSGKPLGSLLETRWSLCEPLAATWSLWRTSGESLLEPVGAYWSLWEAGKPYAAPGSLLVPPGASGKLLEPPGTFGEPPGAS